MKTKLSLETLFENFMFASQVEGKSERTLDQYVRVFKQFKVFCPKNPEDITPQDIREYLFNLTKKGLAKATIWTHFKELSVLFRFLHKEGYLEKNPVSAVAKPKMPKIFPKVLTQEEVRKLVEKAERASKRSKNKKLAKRDFALVCLLLTTGLRVGELIRLKISDISFPTRFLKVFGKGGKEQILPFGQRTGKALLNCFKVRGNIHFEEALFVTRDGNPLDRQQVRRILHKIAKKAGSSKEKVSPHGLRYTCATTWVQLGGDAKKLQELLGHSDSRVADCYIHLTPKDLQRAHNQFDPLEAFLEAFRRHQRQHKALFGVEESPSKYMLRHKCTSKRAGPDE